MIFIKKEFICFFVLFLPFFALGMDPSSSSQSYRCDALLTTRPPLSWSSVVDVDLIRTKINDLEASRLAFVIDFHDKLEADEKILDNIIKDLNPLTPAIQRTRKNYFVKHPEKAAEQKIARQQLFENYSSRDLNEISKINNSIRVHVSTSIIQGIRNDINKNAAYLASEQQGSLNIAPLVKNLLLKRVELTHHTFSSTQTASSSLSPAMFRLSDPKTPITAADWLDEYNVVILSIIDQQLFMLYDLLKREDIIELDFFLSFPSLLTYLRNNDPEATVSSLHSLLQSDTSHLNILQTTPALILAINEFKHSLPNSLPMDIPNLSTQSHSSPKKQPKTKAKNSDPTTSTSEPEKEMATSSFKQEDMKPDTIATPETELEPQPEEPVKPFKYEPPARQPGGSPRELRIQKLITQNQNIIPSTMNPQQIPFTPVKSIILNDKDFHVYQVIFKLSDTKTLLEWKDFERFFRIGLGGEIFQKSGSARTLRLHVLKEDGSPFTATGYIHEPHGVHGTTLGYENLFLLREYLTRCGLSPDTKYIKYEG